MVRERYMVRSILHWHVVMIGADRKETVVEITDSEEGAKSEAARLNREVQSTSQVEQKPGNWRNQ
jgi:hypothetical protein